MHSDIDKKENFLDCFICSGLCFFGITLGVTLGVCIVLIWPNLARAEALENIHPSKRVAQCNEWLSDHRTVGLSARQGHCDEMRVLNEETQGVDPVRREKMKRLTNEVCNSKDIDKWYNDYAKECMEAK